MGVVDVVEAKGFSRYKTLPRGVRHEGRCHGSGFLFLVERHKRLLVPLKMSGQHKLWRLDRKVALKAKEALVVSELAKPVRFVQHRSPESQDRSAQDCKESSQGSDSDENDAFFLELALQRSLKDVQQAESNLADDNHGEENHLDQAVLLSMHAALVETNKVTVENRTVTPNVPQV